MIAKEADEHPPSVQQVLTILIENKIAYELRCFTDPARQASQAAALVSCPLGAIVKSLVFQKATSGELIMALVSGQNRADTQILSDLAGDSVKPARPAVVLAETGYPVGAVPPIGLKGDYPVVMDADLLNYSHVWASAGAENMLMRISSTDLKNLVKARVESLKKVDQV